MIKAHLVYFLLFFVIIFACSCEKDPLSADDCAQIYPGLLCRTYLFEADKGIGYIDYQYDNKILTKEFYKNVKGEVRKAIEYSYNSDLLIVIEKSVDNNSNIREIKYIYTDFNELTECTHYENSVLIAQYNFYYDDLNRLVKQEILHQEMRDSILTYEYDNEGRLWRLSYHDGQMALLGYEIYVIYSNNIKRINTYNPKHNFMGYNLFVYNNNMLETHIFYDMNYNIILRNTYHYKNNELILHEVFNKENQRISHKELFYS